MTRVSAQGLNVLRAVDMGDDGRPLALTSLVEYLSTPNVPESSLGPDGKGDAIGPFGSVFFSNLCRMSWLVKKETSPDPDVVNVGCFPQKQNDGTRARPVSLEFTFTAEDIKVQAVNPASVEAFARRLSLPARIAHLLKTGPQTYVSIATELDAKVNTVIQAVSRSQQFTKVSLGDGVQKIALIDRHHGE